MLTRARAETTLAAHGARVTVLAMWATFCEPCIEELPYIDALYKKYKGDPDVAVMAINIDDADSPRQMADVDAILGKLVLEVPCFVGGSKVMERVTTQDESGRPEIRLPLVAIVDPTFQIHRRTGFQIGISQADYVAQKTELIDSAKRGDKPVERETGVRPLASGEKIKMKLPKMAPEDRPAFLAQLREQLTSMFPTMKPAELDAIMKAAEQAAATGGELEIPVP